MTIKIIFSTTISLILNSCQADFINRRATPQDLNSIMHLYRNFNDDDRSKLVVFPDLIHEEKVKNDILKNKFFVTLDNETSNIVSFLKLFIPDEEECLEILCNELKALGSDQELIENGYYLFNTDILKDYHAQLNPIQTNKNFEYNPSNQICVYYGGAYTALTYRGQRINTKLHDFAFTQIQENVYQKSKEVGDDFEIALLYGQVEENLSLQGIIRCFAQFVFNFCTNDPFFKISFFSYLSSKPEFIFDNLGEIEAVMPDEWKDRGQILTFKKAYYMPGVRTNLVNSSDNLFEYVMKKTT